MPTYILLMRADQAGARAVLGGARLQPDLFARMNGRIVAEWTCSGTYDAVAIVELPERGEELVLSLQTAMQGFSTDVLRAYDAEETAGILADVNARLAPKDTAAE